MTSEPAPGQQPVDPGLALARLRREYGEAGLSETSAGDEPYGLLGRWLADALAAHQAGLISEPNAMALGTVGADGAPSVRIVLLKGIVDGGLCFYTNHESRKGSDLTVEPRCALTLLWHDLQRQVRVEGAATKLDDATSDAYFAARPRASKLGAWASPQSRAVTDRAELDAAYERVEQRFSGVESVPRPPHWGGWCVLPQSVEMWQGRPGRMHDRIRFTRTTDGWSRCRLAP